jgi:hypothetical protein
MMCMPDLNHHSLSRVWHRLIADNGTGAPAGWNWILCLSVSKIIHNSWCTELYHSVFTSFSMMGFDASGHIAEETKNARCVIQNYPAL